MQFETGSIADAQEISALILELSAPFYVALDREGAEPFLASISVSAVRGYMQASNFSYLIARCPLGTLAGLIAMRDQTHLFHLFVAEPFQRKGLGRRLWEQAKARVNAQNAASGFTVNASLNAVPVYESFGFEKQGRIRVAHGVTFQPMRLRGA